MNVIGNGLVEIERFKKSSQTFFIKNNSKFIHYPLFFSSILDQLIFKLKHSSLQTSIKFNLHVDCVYEQIITHEIQNVAFKTQNILGCNSSNFKKLLNNMFNKILEEECEFIAKGSGWSLVSIDGLQLRINKVNPLRGSTYIELPKFIQNKKAVINIKNTDDKCFMYAILTKYDVHLNKSKFSKRNFKILEKKTGLNFKCISFPTPINQIKKFERINKVSVNVYSTL